MKMLKVTTQHAGTFFVNLARVAALRKVASGGTEIFFSMADGGADAITVKEKFDDVMEAMEEAEVVNVNVRNTEGFA